MELINYLTKHSFSLILSMAFFGGAYAEDSGNFSLRGSQQPGPLVGLGENIIDKNQAQLFLTADDIVGKNKYNIDLAPSFLYGITDDFSIYFNYPIAIRFKEDGHHSSGIQDMYIQLEHSIYQSDSDQATVFGNMTFPTGSATKNPSTGLGAPSFLVGTTFMRMYPDWFYFGSPSAVLTTSRHGTKYGNQFNYQVGLGRNIAGVKDEYITAWVVEVTGQFTEKTKLHSATDPDSGGNVIYVTPSFWLSTPRFIFQLGAGLAVSQHLNGHQNKAKYMVMGNVGWTF